MARKACPTCKLVTGWSSKTCSRCGHQFAAVEVVADQRAQRCAMCGVVNSASARRCDCGFEFDQAPEDLRAFYKSRRSNAWVLLFGSVALGVFGSAAILAFIVLSPAISIRLSVFGFIAVIGGAVTGSRKAMRILSATRINLDDLDGKGDVVPQARVISK
jgi:hypothetical protein